MVVGNSSTGITSKGAAKAKANAPSKSAGSTSTPSTGRKTRAGALVGSTAPPSRSARPSHDEARPSARAGSVVDVKGTKSDARVRMKSVAAEPLKAQNVKSPMKPTSVAKAATMPKNLKSTPAKAAAIKPARRVRAKGDGRPSISNEIAEAMLGEMGLLGEDNIVAREAARSQKERDLLGRLAVSMNRADDMPNLELAADIVFGLNAESVSTLIGVLERHDELHAPDAARVLCEVGTREQELVMDHAERLLALCDPDHMEMLPYTMYALAPCAHAHVEALWDMRDLFWQALTGPHPQQEMAQAAAVRLLSALCAAGPDYARTLAGGLVDLLGKCQPKDVAFFAESVLPALGPAHSHRAKPVLDRRMKELTPAEVARLRRAVRAAQTGTPVYVAA